MEATETKQAKAACKTKAAQQEGGKSSGPKQANKTLQNGDVLLDRFMLMRKIGTGGTSEVFRARDLLAVLGGNTSASDIALKVTTAPKQDNINNNLLLREALSTRHLSHPNILRVYDYHRDKNLVFVTMELVDGEPLNEMVARYPDRILSYRQTVSIIDGVASGLSTAHNAGIIHSDIKPANILMGSDGGVKVIDFAASRNKLKNQCNASNPDLLNPQPNQDPGFIAYTLAYASPQLLRDEPPAVSDDIYALACVVYELLSGRQANSNQISRSTAARETANTDNQVKAFRPTKERIKPGCINHRQWQILSSAMSAKGCVKYASVDQFWQGFKAAHTLPHKVLAGAIAAGVVGAGIWFVINQPLPIDTNESAAPTQALQQALPTPTLPIEIGNMDLEQKLAYFTEQSISAAENGEAAIKIHDTQVAVAKSEIISALTEQTESALAYDLNSYQTPNFTPIESLLKQAETLYPDSLRVNELLSQIISEHQQYATYLAVEYDNLWTASDYSIPTALDINTLTSNLKTLTGEDLSTKADDHIERLMASVTSALADADYEKYYQIIVFAQTLKNHPKLTQAVKNLDPKRFASAEALIDYSPENDPNFIDYPEREASIWLKPKLVDLNLQLTNAWKDKSITAIHSSLENLADQFRTTLSAPIFAKTSDMLDEKYRMKLKYHTQRGYQKSHSILTEHYKRLKATL